MAINASGLAIAILSLDEFPIDAKITVCISVLQGVPVDRVTYPVLGPIEDSFTT